MSPPSLPHGDRLPSVETTQPEAADHGIAPAANSSFLIIKAPKIVQNYFVVTLWFVDKPQWSSVVTTQFG